MNPKDDDKNIGQQHWDNLVGAESSAAEEKSKDNPDLDTSKVEDTPSNKIAVDLSSKGQQGNTKQKKGFKGFIKKKLPALLIILALAGGGGAILGSQSMQGFAIANRLIQEFNTMGVTSYRQSNFLLRQILKSTPKSSSSDNLDNLKLGDEQVASLKANNMDIVEVDLDGNTTMRYLKYTDADGLSHAITGDTDGISKLASVGVTDAIDLSSAKANLPDFDTRFTAATATYSGQNAGWYDSVTSRLIKKLGLSRNRFKDSTPDESVDDFKETAKSKQNAKGAQEIGDEITETKDEETGEIKREKSRVTSSESDDLVKPGDSEAEVRTKLTNKAQLLANGAQAGVGTGCMVQTISGTLNDMANAAELIQILNLVNGFLNSVQQVQAGVGSNAQMGNYLSLLNKADADGKTAIQAQGMSQLFGGTADFNDVSVQKFNFEKSSHSLLNGAITVEGVTIDEMQKCSYARLATNVTGVAVKGALALAGPIGQASLGIWGIVKKVGITLGVAGIVSAMLPRIASFMARDLVSDALGPDLGNALAIGGRSYLGANHKQRGGSPGGETVVAAFYKEQEEYIAHQAQYERATHSPFDASSQYTFLGTLYSSLFPLATANNTFGILSSLTTSTFTSIGKILPSTAADGFNTTLTYEKDPNCPVSGDIGVVSGLGCNPIIVTDTSTFDIPIETLIAIVDSLDANNFEHDTDGKIVRKNGNPVINTSKDSPLFRYATLCGQKQVNYGFADSTATAQLTSTGNSSLDTLLTGFGAAVDTVGDIEDIISAATEIGNREWISGLYCVANASTNPKWESEMKYYQRYLEYQGTLEGMGIVEQSSLSAVLEAWDEQNPINTYEDLLAYYSGHTKEEVQLALDYVEYQDALAAYHPEKMAPLSPEEEPSAILFDADNFAFIKVNEPLISRAAEFQSEVALRENKRAVYQSI